MAGGLSVSLTNPVAFMAGAGFAHVASGIVSSGLAPTFALLGQKAWQGQACLLPDASALIAAHMRGFLPEKQTRNACLLQGVDYSGFGLNNAATPHPWLWHRVALAHLHRPSAEVAIDGMLRGFWDETFARELVKRGGGSWAWWRLMGDYVRDYPSVADAINMRVKGLATDDEFAEIVKRAGGSLPHFQAILPAHYHWPEYALVVEARNRGMIEQGQFYDLLTRQGYVDPDVRSLLERLRHFLPSVGDVLRFSIRGALNGTTAEMLGLYDNQPPEYAGWMEAVGADMDTGDTRTKDGVLQPLKLYDYLWAGSRRIMSVSEAQEAYHRLRPGSMTEINKFVPDATPFTRFDLRAVMEAHGVPSKTTPALEELGFLPLSLREIRTVVKLGTRPKEWVVARFQDQGHRKDRAEDLYDIIYAQEQWRQNSGRRRIEEGMINVLAREVLDSYEEGTIDSEGAWSNLTQLGFKKETITFLLAARDSKVQRKIVRTGILAAKRDYIGGTLNAEETALQLQQMGVATARISQYLSVWTLQRSRVRRTATTAQILSFLQAGLEDEATAAVRLQNLGWDKPDIVAMLASVKGKLAQIKARQALAAEKSAMVQAKQLAAAQKQAQQLVKSLQADQRRATPRSTLDKWLCDGIISEGYYLNRMNAMGYGPALGKKYLDDAKRKKACAPAATDNGAPQEAPPEQGAAPQE